MSNQSNMTRFDLIRSHETCLLVRQQVSLKSSDCSHWMDSRITSTQPTVYLWYNLGSRKTLVQNKLSYFLSAFYGSQSSKHLIRFIKVYLMGFCQRF